MKKRLDFIEKLPFFHHHCLNLNAEKIKFITFCKPSKNELIKNSNLIVRNNLIKVKDCVKYLGVHLDQNLTYQEVKNILQKMVKAWFNRIKIQPAHDLRIRCKVYQYDSFWTSESLTFLEMQIQPTASFFNAENTKCQYEDEERTSNLVYTASTKHELLKNNIFRRVVPLWHRKE